MACGRPIVGCGPIPQAVNSAMKTELRLVQKFVPSQSSIPPMKPMETHQPHAQLITITTEINNGDSFKENGEVEDDIQEEIAVENFME